MAQDVTFDTKARIRAFLWLFAGIALDLRKEARLARRVGIAEARRRMSQPHRKRAIHFRETATRMGGVVIKLGQFLSARADLLPEEYVRELSKLQDEVPPVPYEDIAGVVSAAFGRPLADVFETFERVPVAAASLAQVHYATLPDQTPVAVKVQRPKIQDLCDIDLATFAWLMDGVHRFTRWGSRYDLPGLVGEFARTLSDELDFCREGWHAERFKENFSDHPIIYIPDVYWEYTTDLVLTLERVDGIKISDYAALEKAGIDRHVVADEVFQSYTQQILVDGLFHADPHPGNLFVVAGPDGPRITYVDFGMVGEITSVEQELFTQGVVAGSRRDFAGLVAALSKLGFIRAGSSLEPIERAIAFMFETYSGTGSRHVAPPDALDAIQEDIRTLVYEQPFDLPSKFGFLGRAVGTMVGLVSGLDPRFDFVEAVRPYVARAGRRDPAIIARTVAGEAARIVRALVELPARLDAVLGQIQRDGLKVRGEAPRGPGMPARTGGGTRAVILTMWAITFVVCGAVLFVSHFEAPAFASWGLALVVLVAFGWLERPRRPRGPWNPHSL